MSAERKVLQKRNYKIQASKQTKEGKTKIPLVPTDPYGSMEISMQ
jgi:hypothetical protein